MASVPPYMDWPYYVALAVLYGAIGSFLFEHRWLVDLFRVLLPDRGNATRVRHAFPTHGRPTLQRLGFILAQCVAIADAYCDTANVRNQ